MTETGSIAAIHRYPVKSMLGEDLETSLLGIDGIPGDRGWGVRDEVRGDFFVGKRSAGLMACRAWYPNATTDIPQIQLPDGNVFSADAEEAAELVGKIVGCDVTLWPVMAEARPTTPKDRLTLLDEMQAMMARVGDEPMPDFSDPPPELLEVYARGGPFFDAFPLLLMSRQSIDSIARAAPDSRIDARRFRPNLLIEADQPGSFPEQDWIGHRVRVGDAVLKVQSTCVRCVMTTHGFAELPKDPLVMRTLVKEADGNLGVYATVEEPGEIARAASVTLLD